MELEKLRKGCYYENISHRYIDLKNKTWQVSNECTGKIYFTSKTLKDCKRYISAENEIKEYLN